MAHATWPSCATARPSCGQPTRRGSGTDLAPRPFRVVYAGTLGRSQGLEVVVRAAAVVESRGLPIEVRIVGAGNDATQLAALVRSLGAPVTIGPPIPHAEIDALYGWADTLVVSLRDWEPFQWTVPSSSTRSWPRVTTSRRASRESRLSWSWPSRQATWCPG
ncbi:glycosyltransferase [Oerskovia sp. M15]